MARCRICKKKKAVVFIPHHRLPLCEEDFISWFQGYVQKTIQKFHMFSKKDKLLLGVSGGKDSLVLWQVLVRLGYHVDGLFIDLGIDEFSIVSKTIAQNWAQKLGRNLHIIFIKEKLGLTIPKLRKHTSKYCSLCGSIKRYFLNRMTKVLGYDVLVTGHNLDDEASSLLGNILQWNLKYLGKKYPVLPEGHGFPRKVKPLCRVTSYEIKQYAKRIQIKYLKDSCPLSFTASRLLYAEILESLEEKMPGTKLRFYMEYLKKVYPIFKESRQDFFTKELVLCEECGEPAVSTPCFICRIKKRYKQ